jgi:hypothetical protein
MALNWAMLKDGNVSFTYDHLLFLLALTFTRSRCYCQVCALSCALSLSLVSLYSPPQSIQRVLRLLPVSAARC